VGWCFGICKRFECDLDRRLSLPYKTIQQVKITSLIPFFRNSSHLGSKRILRYPIAQCGDWSDRLICVALQVNAHGTDIEAVKLSFLAKDYLEFDTRHSREKCAKQHISCCFLQVD